jgi:hypothetical protein
MEQDTDNTPRARSRSTELCRETVMYQLIRTGQEDARVDLQGSRAIGTLRRPTTTRTLPGRADSRHGIAVCACGQDLDVSRGRNCPRCGTTLRTAMCLA